MTDRSTATDEQAAPAGTVTADRLDALVGPARAALLRHLRTVDGMGVRDAAELLGVSDVAARRHLRLLADDGHVSVEQRRQRRGRPAAHYRLTPRGRGLFPHRYDRVAGELLEFITAQQGRDQLRRYLRWRLRRETDRYRVAVTGETLPQRLQQLADALSSAGYEANVEVGDDEYVLTQDHCAIFEVARHHPEMCQYEAATFSRVLGEDVTVRRHETLADGGPACVCRVQRRGHAHSPRPPAAADRTTDPSAPNDHPTSPDPVRPAGAPNE